MITFEQKEEEIDLKLYNYIYRRNEDGSFELASDVGYLTTVGASIKARELQKSIDGWYIACAFRKTFVPGQLVGNMKRMAEIIYQLGY